MRSVMGRIESWLAFPIVLWIERFVLPPARQEPRYRRWAVSTAIFVTCTPFVIGGLVYKALRMLWGGR